MDLKGTHGRHTPPWYTEGMTQRLFAFAIPLVLLSCQSKAPADPFAAVPGTQVLFDPTADLASQDHFYDFPWPSDFRLNAAGHPDMRGFVNGSDNTLVSGLLETVSDRVGFPVISAAYFRFNGALAPTQADTVIA